MLSASRTILVKHCDLDHMTYVKGATLVPAFFFFFIFVTAPPGNSLVPVLIQDEMVGWHHRLDGQEFEQAMRVGWTGKPGMLQSMGLQRVRHD